MDQNTAEETSLKFWKALEASDTKKMRKICDPTVTFVHIGVTCGLDEEMRCFDEKIFNPTDITIHSTDVSVYGNTAIVITDCDYGLLLDGKPTTHHFAVTEVYIEEEGKAEACAVQFYGINLLMKEQCLFGRRHCFFMLLE